MNTACKYLHYDSVDANYVLKTKDSNLFSLRRDSSMIYSMLLSIFSCSNTHDQKS